MKMTASKMKLPKLSGANIPKTIAGIMMKARSKGKPKK